MKPYFDNAEKVARLQFHALEWIETPFMPNGCIKGAGVSCQKLVGAIYRELGVLPANYEIPEGPMNWSNGQTESLVEAAVLELPNFQRLPDVHQPAPGDLLGIAIGGCIHHCGIVLGTDGKFIHCLRGPGVVLSSTRDASYLKRIEKIWRPML